MSITRRELLSMVAAMPFARIVAGDDRAGRIRAHIHAFESQGIHRTGTAVDRLSAEWLPAEVPTAGLTPPLVTVSLPPVGVVNAKGLTPELDVDVMPRIS